MLKRRRLSTGNSYYAVTLTDSQETRKEVRNTRMILIEIVLKMITFLLCVASLQ